MSDLSERKYGELMNVARSANEQYDAGIDTDAPKKAELIDAMEDAGFEVDDDDQWTFEGDEVERLESQYDPERSSNGNPGPRDKTVLYCLTRAETTEDRVEAISDALDEAGFRLDASASGDKYSIVLPAENDPEQEHLFEEDEEEDEPTPAIVRIDSDEDDGYFDAREQDESDAESDSESEEDDDPSEEDESAEEESEADESEGEEEDDDLIPREAARARLMERPVRPKDAEDEKSLYQIATDLDISGRSSMTKDELVDAILDAREGTKVAPAA